LHIELRAVVCKDGVGDGRQQQQQQSQQPIMVDVSLMEVTMAAEVCFVALASQLNASFFWSRDEGKA